MQDLQQVLKEDDSRRLLSLIDQGLDVRSMSRDLVTLLGVATRAGAMECMRLLVERGAVIEAGDPSPIQIAIEMDRVDLLQELIRLGAKIQGPDVGYDADYPAPIVLAIEARNAEAVETLLSEGALEGESWAVVDDAYRAALDLHGKNKWAILEQLVRDLADREMELPTDAGSILRALKILKPRARKAGASKLLNAVEAVSRRLDRAKAELSEAEDAFLEDRFEDLFDLIEGVPDSRRPGILGIVAASATDACYCFSEWLLESGAAANLCDDEGKTSLMHVAEHASHYLLGALLRTGRAALYAEDEHGRTAQDYFHIRANHQFSQADPAVRSLSGPGDGHEVRTPLTSPRLVELDQKTDPVYLRDTPDYVRTAAQLTRERKLSELLTHLKRRESKEEEWKMAAGAVVLEDCIADNMTLLESCLDEGADVNIRNDMGNTPLLGACDVYITPVRILKKIVGRGADLSATDARGRDALTIARRTWPEGHECREYIETIMIRG